MKNLTFKNKTIQFDASWNKFFNTNIISQLSEIESKIKSDFTPNPEKVFSFLLNPVNSIKCIIIGQDPYPQPGVATGRAFEVGGINSWESKKLNTSLRNMLKLLHCNKFGLKKPAPISIIREDLNNGKFLIKPPNELFAHWESEGVLLLNTALTCEIGTTSVSNSHSILWKNFSEELIKFISDSNQNAKWFLWGTHAKISAKSISANAKFECNHPRLNDYKPGSFFAENHFKKLEKQINWYG